MAEKISSLEQKYNKIKEKLGNQVNIFFDDIRKIFPDTPKNSMYWTVSKLVQTGYLKRVRSGVYELNEARGKRAVHLSDMARKVRKILDEEGYEYYISGMDILLKFMHHVPESYPIIVFGEKRAIREILQALKNNKIMAINPKVLRQIYDEYIYKSEEPLVILYPTESFMYAENNIATNEKTFIDLFFAVTRNQYPLALQELARSYNNMLRIGAIDQKLLVKMSYQRNLQHDIRYIVESKYISKGAIEFVKSMKLEG